jgi:hypothetical protein
MFCNIGRQCRTVLFEIFVFLGIDQRKLLGCGRARCAVTTATDASAAGAGADRFSAHAVHGGFNLLQSKDRCGCAGDEVIGTRRQQVVTVEGDFLFGSIDNLVVRTLPATRECELNAVAVGEHLFQDFTEIFRCQGFDLAIPAFGFCGVQNKEIPKNDDVIFDAISDTIFNDEPSVYSVPSHCAAIASQLRVDVVRKVGNLDIILRRTANRCDE